MKKTRLKLLLLEDEPFDAELNIAALEAGGYACEWARVQTKTDFLHALKTPDYEIILIDYNLPGFDGMSALHLLQEHDIKIPVLFVTGNLQPELAIDSIKAGALDFVHKDRLTRLAPSVNRALEETEIRRDAEARKKALEFAYALNQFANQGAALDDLAAFIAKRAPEQLACESASVHLVDSKESNLVLYYSGTPAKKYEKIEKLLKTVGISIPSLSIPLGDDLIYSRVISSKEEKTLVGDEDVLGLLKDYLQASPFSERIKEKISLLLPKIMTLVNRKKVHLFPMISAGQAIGLLELSYRNEDQSSDPQRVKDLLEQTITVIARKMAEDNLVRAHRDQKLILDSAGEGIFGLDNEGRLTFVNPKAAVFLGYRVEELAGKKNHTIFHCEHEDDSSCREEEYPICHTYRNGKNIHQEQAKFIRKDGTTFPVSFSSAVIMDGDERVGAVVIFQDITEQVEARREIARLAQVVEQANISIIMTDLDAKITYVNSFFEKISGYAQEEALGENPRFLQSGYQDKAFYEDLWNHLTKGQPWHGTFVNKKKDGTLYHEDAHIFPVITSEGEIINYAAVKRDITAKVEANKALQEEKAFSERIIQTSTAIIVGLDKDHKIRLFNKGAEEITGYTAAEALGKDWFAIFLDEETLKEMNDVWKDAWRGDKLYGYENPILTREGEQRIISWQNTKIYEDLPQERQLVISIGEDITQRVEDEQQIRAQLRQLNTLHQIDRAILSNLNTSFRLQAILKEVCRQLNIDAANLLLYGEKEDADIFTFAASVGFRSDALTHTHLKLGEGLAGKAALDQEVIHIPDLEKDPHFSKVSPVIAEENFVAYWGIPLLATGRVIGVLELFHRSTHIPSAAWQGFLEMLKGQVAIAVYNASLIEGLQKSNQDLRIAYDETLEGWAHALELRDMETEGHSRRVTRMTEKLATAMGIEEPEIEHVRRGALLHDIGKMGIPDAILHKAGPLTDEEWEIMQQHPVYAYELIRGISFLASAAEIPRSHHERWDGSGYPEGLQGEEIPLPARVFAIIDVYDALSSDRPYRKAWTQEKILAHLRAESGKHFDPAVVKAFFDLFPL